MLEDRTTPGASHVRPLVVFETVPQKLILVIKTENVVSSFDGLYLDVSSHAACREAFAGFRVYSVGPTVVYA